MTGAELMLLTSGREIESYTPSELWDLEDALGAASDRVRAHLDAFIVEWTEEGCTQQWIAEQVGRSQSVVSDRQRRLGVEPMSNRGRPRKIELSAADNSDGGEPEILDAIEVLEPDEETEVPAPTTDLPPRTIQNAHADKKRIETMIGTCQAWDRALDDVKVELAAKVATVDELEDWRVCVKDAIAALRRFEQRIPKEGN